MSVEIRQANDRKTMNDFIAFPRALYKGSKEYIPDLDSDVRNFFDPKKNDSLRYARIQPFVAYRDGVCVGRVAALISNRANTKWNRKSVRFTYLDFIDDYEVSSELLETVERWGRKLGMKVCEGPLGITDFDKEGMLIEDFHLGGGTMEFWNYPYYAEHMRRAGYDKAVDWLQVRVKVPEEVPAKYARVAALSKEMFGLRVVKATKKQIMKEGWGQRLFQLFNEAFAPLYGTSIYSKDQTEDYLRQYVPLLDLELVPFILNEKDEIVGAAVTMRDLSPALNKTHGRLLPLGWAHLAKALIMKKAEKAQLMIIAVRPDMQGLGLNALIFDDLILPSIDTLKVLRKVTDGLGNETLETVPDVSLDRETVFRAQTPQMFLSEDIKAAYDQAFDTAFTDDASVAQKKNIPLSYIEGERYNIKITTRDDLDFAKAILTIRNWQ